MKRGESLTVACISRSFGLAKALKDSWHREASVDY